MTEENSQYDKSVADIERNDDQEDNVDRADNGINSILDQAGISRRQFVAAAVATGGALTLGDQVAASHTSKKTNRLYEFIQRHTSPDYEIQTLIHLNDVSGQNKLDTLAAEWDGENGDIKFRHTSEPELASYSHLTTAQSQEIIELDVVDSLEFSPGANPFWKIDKYNEGVFPSVDDSVHYIGYNEMIAGMEYLANKYSDRLNFYSVGQSAGYHNLLTGEDDRKGMWVVELTNNIDDEKTFAQKSKVAYTLSIHGDERVGAETGCRFIESVLEGNEPEVNDRLDDAVILCAFANPDGWVVRQPQYIGIPNNFNRENGASFDLNRSYPSAGLINPAHYPAEPYGQNLENDQQGEIDDDVPDRTLEHAPESLALIEWLRGYENHEALVDLHGKGLSNEFAYSLSPTSRQFDHVEQHDTQELMRVIGEYMFDELGSIEDDLDDIAPGLVRFNLDPDDPEAQERLPNQLYNYGTITDTLGYLATGEARSWFAALEEFGGFETKAITPEMTLSNKAGGVVQEHTPSLLNLQVRGFLATMRASIAHGTASVDANIDSSGRNTAIIYTDAVTRSSDDLVFADTEMVRTTQTTNIEAGKTKTVTIDVSDQANQLTVNIDHERDIYATLHDPNDTQINEYNSVDENGRGAEWCIADPVPGEWIVTIKHRDADDTVVEATVDIDTLIIDDSTSTADGMVLTPDPVEALGYEQREYEATPFQYFEDYDDFLTDAEDGFDFVSVGDVRNGALINNEDTPAYENVVLVHNDDLSNIARSLDTFVEAGGNLVLTDTGVLALPKMNTAGAADISNTDVTAIERQFALLDPAPGTPDADEQAAELPSRNPDHPLLTNTDGFNQELFGISSVGYPENEAPLTLIDPSAFQEANGQIAARTSDKVSVGTLGAFPTETGEESGGIQVISGLVPPPNQHYLHPFGLLDYGVEFLGHTIMTNALGYEQHRYVNGEVTEMWTDPTPIRDSQ